MWDSEKKQSNAFVLLCSMALSSSLDRIGLFSCYSSREWSMKLVATYTPILAEFSGCDLYSSVSYTLTNSVIAIDLTSVKV